MHKLDLKRKLVLNSYLLYNLYTPEIISKERVTPAGQEKNCSQSLGRLDVTCDAKLKVAC